MTLKQYFFLYLIAIGFTIFSVFFFDRLLAEFAYNYLGRHWILEYFSYIPKILELVVVLCLLACMHPQWRKHLAKLTISLSATLVCALSIRYFGKWVFGRTWPETWKDNNLSWLRDGIEGFFPFKEGIAYNSFPSGHALVTLALTYVFWYYFPKLTWLWVIVITLALIGQFAQYYHYLGDLCAGAILGCLCAQTVLKIQYSHN